MVIVSILGRVGFRLAFAMESEIHFGWIGMQMKVEISID